MDCSPDVLKSVATALRFYLSPGNLCHDKVLSRYLTQQKRIPIDTFLTFNQIRSLCNDHPTVEVLKEGFKLMADVEVQGEYVALKCEICTKDVEQWKEQAERATVYVDSLPEDWDREHLRRLFCQFGEILYISLPKFPETHIPKGFAFIQFRSPLSAQASLSLHSTTPNGLLRPLTVLSKSAWQSFKPQFHSLQARIEVLLHSN